ncbi:MAG: CDP-alcohol phosphatidyltransferase family protein [Thermoplasmata archaeon]|nr:CDP-alcohol phosphatidyltransferase family protein [Thermoplasmata archaeon]
MAPSRIWANLSTLANGTLGVGAIAYVVAGNKLWAMLLIVAGIGFDGLDGWLSRRSGRPGSRFGPLADSVADAVTFGLAPAALIIVHTDRVALWSPWTPGTLLAGVVIASLAIARLTWFTLRAHDRPYFTGAPTPQNAIGVVLLLLLFDDPAFLGTLPLAVVVLGLVLAVLMVVPVRFPKIRVNSPLRIPMTVAGFALILALLPLQFRPNVGSPLYDVSFVATGVAVVLATSYYAIGPSTVAKVPTTPG